jgi:hypothetical protein
VLTVRVTESFVLPPQAMEADPEAEAAGEGGAGIRAVAAESPLLASGVTLVCTTGRMRGVHEQPETVARGASGRMVIAAVAFTYLPLAPFAVAVASPDAAEPGQGQGQDSVFWSDIGGGGAGVYRALADGTQAQGVLAESGEVAALHLYGRGSGTSASSDVSGSSGCDALGCAADAALFPQPRETHDALFYVDASRAYGAGSGGVAGDSRDGVAGVLPVRRDGTLLEEPAVSAKPVYVYPDSSSASSGTCVAGGRSGTVSLPGGGVQFRAVAAAGAGAGAGGDTLLLGGLRQPRSVTLDETSG